MNETALQQFSNSALSLIAVIFVLGANQNLITRRPRWWLAFSLLATATMYFSQFAFALSEPSGGLTRNQSFVLVTFNLVSTFCLGIAVLSHYKQPPHRERTSAIVLVPVLIAAAGFDLVFPGWYALSVVNFVLFGILAWELRHEDIATAMGVSRLCLSASASENRTGWSLRF